MWLHEGNNAIIPLGVDSNTLHTEWDMSFIFYFLTFIWQPNVCIHDFIWTLIRTKKNKSLIHDNINWNFSINIFYKGVVGSGIFHRLIPPHTSTNSAWRAPSAGPQGIVLWICSELYKFNIAVSFLLQAAVLFRAGRIHFERSPEPRQQATYLCLLCLTGMPLVSGGILSRLMAVKKLH